MNIIPYRAVNSTTALLGRTQIGLAIKQIDFAVSERNRLGFPAIFLVLPLEFKTKLYRLYLPDSSNGDKAFDELVHYLYKSPLPIEIVDAIVTNELYMEYKEEPRGRCSELIRLYPQLLPLASKVHFTRYPMLRLTDFSHSLSPPQSIELDGQLFSLATDESDPYLRYEPSFIELPIKKDPYVELVKNKIRACNQVPKNSGIIAQVFVNDAGELVLVLLQAPSRIPRFNSLALKTLHNTQFPRPITSAPFKEREFCISFDKL
jgi:hypothetical protein